MHKEMRRIFLSKLETTTNGEGVMNISCQSKGNAWGQTDRRGASTTNPLSTRMTWQDRGGEHLHFTVYKENKDTMEIVSFICRQLKLPAKNLQFAGTKDRRAVTSQRVSAYRVAADRIAGLNRTLRNSKVGDFEYKPYGLELGDLQGNEFVITLRDCRVADSTTSDLERLRETVQGRVSKIADNGFINYYGLQRFGSFSIRTDTVGLMMLKGDFKGACDALLEYSPEALEAALDPMSGINNEKNISSDDKARAHAIYAFQKRGKGHQALRDLPRKFSAEMAIIRHLSNEQRANDFQSALQSVPRNLRLMYVHAYQSLIWNVAASKRWGMHGSKVVEGDLILVENQKKEADADGDAPEEVDESGEVVIHPAGGDSAALEAKRFERARPLSQEEAESGKHTIFDIVLPTPGFDVLYPSNDLGDFYKTYMAGDEGGGLDPHRMRRSWKDISLSGNYRKVLSRPLNGGKVEFELKEYVDDNEQMVPTDLDILEKRQAGKGKSTEASGLSGSNGNEERIDEEEVQQKKPAVILKFQLGSSQYATMILRELMGRDAVHVYKPDFGGAR
jgi:tRNA pseudouridine13 synthase